MPSQAIALFSRLHIFSAFILNMWFHNGSEAVCHLLPAVIIIGLMHRNVLDDYADKGSFRLWPFAAYICVVTGQVDEVDHDVEGGEADTGVECRYGFCKGGFGGVIFESIGRMIDDPERHNDLSANSLYFGVLFVNQLSQRHMVNV
jgi:hypothetical protein